MDLGSIITDNTLVDKYALYKIARYCDELVPDGEGGTEPRFTCNHYISKQETLIKFYQILLLYLEVCFIG